MSIEGKLNERMRVVLVVTHSRKGFTDNMAKAIAEGVEEVPNVKALIRRVNEVQPSDFVEADALAIGSPTYLDYISGELKHLLDNIMWLRKTGHGGKMDRLEGKPAAAFVSGHFTGYLLRARRLQFKSVSLKELERILKKITQRKVVDGIYLIHDVSSTDPRAPLPLTSDQAVLCKNLGRKLALSTGVES